MPEDHTSGHCESRTPMGRSCSRKWPWIQTFERKWDRINGAPGLSITCFSPLTPAPPFRLPMFLRSRAGPNLDDDPVVHIPADHRTSRCASCEHTVVGSWPPITSHLSINAFVPAASCIRDRLQNPGDIPVAAVFHCVSCVIC